MNNEEDERYLLSYILGDGMIKHYPGHGYEVRIDEKNYEHARYLAELIMRLYGIKPVLVRDKFKNT